MLRERGADHAWITTGDSASASGAIRPRAAAAPRRSSGDWGLAVEGRGISGWLFPPSRVELTRSSARLECVSIGNWDLGREEGEYRKAISRTVGGRGGEHHEYKICLLKKIMASLIWYSD